MAWTGCSTGLSGDAEHVLDLLRLVFLPAPEHIGLATFSVPDLMHLSLNRDSQYLNFVGFLNVHTMVPKVMSPTRAYGGIRLKLTTIASRRAFKSSSSIHVSTTNKKMGGT